MHKIRIHLTDCESSILKHLTHKAKTSKLSRDEKDVLKHLYRKLKEVIK